MGDYPGSESTWFQARLESALHAYEETVGVILAEHPLAVELQSCHSVESSATLLKYEAQSFGDPLGESDRIIKPIERIVSMLFTLSSTNLGDADSLQYTAPKAILSAIAILLTVAKGVTSSLDALVDLLEYFGRFLSHLDIYTRISHTPSMDEIAIKIMLDLLATLALVTKELKQGRSIKLVKDILGEVVKLVLQRLDRLTQEEARNTAAQTLEIIYNLVQNTTVVMNGGKASLDGLLEALEILHEAVSYANESKCDKLQREIRSWLSPPDDPWKNYNIARRSRHSGTGAWFVQGGTFSEWTASGPASLLWVHGKPGSGKTVLCSTIIDVIGRLQKYGLASLAIFFYDFREDRQNDLRGLLSSVLDQLCCQSDSYFNVLSKFYWEHNNGSRRPSDDALCRCLKDLLELPGQAPIFLLVDALDECPITSAPSSPREKVLMVLEDLVNSQLPNLRICVTSRPLVDIRPVLESLAFRSVSLHDESGQTKDIDNYIKFVVNTNGKMRRWKPEHKQLVIDVLSKRADGMFKWVYCQLDYLADCLPGRIRHALDGLPETLDGTYERILQKIEDANWEFARRLLQCVAVAFRPLRVEELAELLAFDFQARPIPKFHEDWRVEDPLEAVLSTCSTLLAPVITDFSRRVIQFSHFSVKEFLTSSHFAERSDAVSRRCHISMTSAHTLITQASLGILLHLDKNVTKSSLENFPLARYAAQHWFEHARFEGVSRNVEEGMKQLFDPGKHHTAVWLWISDPIDYLKALRLELEELDKQPLPPDRAPIQYAVFCGLPGIVNFLVVEHSQDVHSRGGYEKSTLLHLASREGHVAVARFLVEQGIDVMAQDLYGMTPLHDASRSGSVEAVRFLIGHGSDATVQAEDGSTPLHVASSSGNVEIARFLVENGADPTAQDKNGSTPLHHATYSLQGSLDVARFLLERGADPASRDKDESTPLHNVLKLAHGSMEVVRSLVGHGADTTAQDKDASTPLHLASRMGQIEAVRLLIEQGADPTTQDKDGSTPLHLASQTEQIEAVRLLIEHSADLTSQDKNGSTPLHLASGCGRVEIAQFLVEHGADPTAQDKGGLTPLHLASSSPGDMDEALELLNEHKNMRKIGLGDEEWMRQELGSLSGNVEITRLLVTHGVDVTARTKDGSTPLHLASRQGSVGVARFLLEHGADVTAEDKDGLTPLHLASREGYTDVERLIVDHWKETTLIISVG